MQKQLDNYIWKVRERAQGKSNTGLYLIPEDLCLRERANPVKHLQQENILKLDKNITCHDQATE